jgi:hypothetical protein
LAALAILAAVGDALYGCNRDTVHSAAPAETADLIDSLRAARATLFYDPVTKALRTHTQDAIAASIGPWTTQA